MSKAREFWVRYSPVTKRYTLRRVKPIDDIEGTAFKVIEKSAYDKAMGALLNILGQTISTHRDKWALVTAMRDIAHEAVVELNANNTDVKSSESN